MIEHLKGLLEPGGKFVLTSAAKECASDVLKLKPQPYFGPDDVIVICMEKAEKRSQVYRTYFI